MITKEQAAQLKMGNKLIAYRQAHVRIGEATPVEFEPCLVLGVRPNCGIVPMVDAVGSANGDRGCDEPRITIAYKGGDVENLRGGRLFFTMSDASDAVTEDIVDIHRMINAIQASWTAYFEAESDRPNEPPFADR